MLDTKLCVHRILDINLLVQGHFGGLKTMFLSDCTEWGKSRIIAVSTQNSISLYYLSIGTTINLFSSCCIQVYPQIGLKELFQVSFIWIGYDQPGVQIRII